MLKKRYYLAFLLSISFTIVNCQKDTGTNTEIQTQQWTRIADVSAPAFRGSASFSIGTIGYFVTGMSGDVLISSVWAYNSETNTWAKKGNYPGTLIVGAGGFSVGLKGYLYGGTDNRVQSTDFWEYDSTTDIWTKLTGFPGVEKIRSFSFVIGTKAYFFSDSINPDVWEYDTLTKVWTKKAGFPGRARVSSASFVIGNKGYYGAGIPKGEGYPTTIAFSTLKDFWEFDPAANTWTKKNDFPGEPRGYAKGFAVGGKGYLGLGIKKMDAYYNLTMVNDFWEYNPQNDQWTKKGDYAGQARAMSSGFVIGTNIYIGMGNNSLRADLIDCWKFDTTK